MTGTFNVVAIKDNGSPVSTQLWDGTFAKAENILRGWIKEELGGTSWHHRIVMAAINDSRTGLTTRFIVDYLVNDDYALVPAGVVRERK